MSFSKATSPSVIGNGGIGNVQTSAGHGSISVGNSNQIYNGPSHTGAASTINIPSNVLASAMVGSGYATGYLTVTSDMGSGLTFGSAGEKAISFHYETDDFTVSFFECVDGQNVRARLEPEGDLRPIEQLRISNLIIALDSRNSGLKPISYIRRHNLERHFRFTQE